MKLETFRSLVLRQHKWQVVHAVSLTKNTVKERHQPRMSKNGFEPIRNQ